MNYLDVFIPNFVFHHYLIFINVPQKILILKNIIKSEVSPLLILNFTFNLILGDAILGKTLGH